MADFDFQQSAPTIQELLNSIPDKAEQTEVDVLRALYEALTQSAPVIIQPSDTWPVASPSEGVIYRVIDRTNTPPQYYSDYMWNGSTMVLMAQYNNAIDDVPTAGSNNLVKSGGVFKTFFSRDFSLPLFEFDSDLSVYNGIRIYDIVSSSPVTTSDKITLAACGVLGNYAIILITKNGGTAESDYLAQYYVPLANIPNDEIQTLTAERYGSNTVDYHITLNVSDLKTIASTQYNTQLYINKLYLNSKFNIDDSIIDIPQDKSPLVLQFPKLDLYVDDEIVDNGDETFCLVTCWYENNTLTLAIGKNNSGGKAEMYYIDKIIENFDSLQGKHQIVFGENTESARFCYYDSEGVRHDELSNKVFRFVVTFDVDNLQNFQFFPFSGGTSLPESLIEVKVKRFSSLGIVTYANDSAAFERFYKQVDGLLTGDYILGSGVQLAENQKIIGAKCNIVPTDSGYFVLRKGTSIQGVRFVNAWQIPHQEDQSKESGIDAHYTMQDLSSLPDNYSSMVLGGKNPVINFAYNNEMNASVVGCIFENIGRCAIEVDARAHRSAQQPYISGCYFVGCWTAISVIGEFVKISNCSVDNCLFGIVLKSGNSNIFGCILKRCDSALYIYNPSGNGLHGEFVSCEIAHCPLNGIYVKSSAVDLGHLFIGVHIADAGIEGENVNSLMFSGCRLESWVNFASGAKNSVVNSIISDDYATMYGKNLFTVPSDTNLKNNRNMTGNDSDVNN